MLRTSALFTDKRTHGLNALTGYAAQDYIYKIQSYSHRPGLMAAGPDSVTTRRGAFYLEKFREILGSSEGILWVVFM